MKNIFGLVGALVVIVGCSKGVSDEEPVSGKSPAGGPPMVKKVEPGPPATNSPTQSSPKPTSPPVGAPPVVNRGNPSTLPVESSRIPVNTGSVPPRATPKENPAAAPPKPGEKIANNFKFEIGQKTVEVEGICKLTEDEAICWKPDGQKNEALATELTNAIKSKSDSYSNTFQMKFLKKNRILVVKTTTKPMKAGTYGGGSYSLGLMNEYSGGMDMQEGWTNGNSAFSGSNGSNFDQTQIDRQVLSGSFSKETKVFPLRYQFTEGSTEGKVIPFAKGQFTIDGNTYELVSVSDKPESGQPGRYMGSMPAGAKPPKYTYVKFQAIKITNPYTILSLVPADDSGKPYGGLNDKGDPITQEEQRKLQMEENKKMMEAQQSGKPYNYPAGRMNGMNYIQSVSLDPSNKYMNGAYHSMFNVDGSKIKKLAIGVSKRTVFVFDKIRLDSN